jgi:hypothetical protein
MSPDGQLFGHGTCKLKCISTVIERAMQYCAGVTTRICKRPWRGAQGALCISYNTPHQQSLTRYTYHRDKHD